LANQLGIIGTSNRVKSGHINGKKALSVLKGNDVINSYSYTDKDLGEYDYLFKIIVLGDGGVGKTALALRGSHFHFRKTCLSGNRSH